MIPHTKVELVPVGAYYRKADFHSVYVSTNCLKEWSMAGPLETGELLSVGDTGEEMAQDMGQRTCSVKRRE